MHRVSLTMRSDLESVVFCGGFHRVEFAVVFIEKFV